MLNEVQAMIKVKAIGSSPKGQYVAFEEYGFKNGQTIPFSKIRVMNVWKGKYVEVPVHIIGTNEDSRLTSIRVKAKEMAKKKLKKFDISM